MTEQDEIDRVLEWIRQNHLELLVAFNLADINGHYQNQSKEEIYVTIMRNFDNDTVQEKMLLSYLTNQGITISGQQQGVLRLIREEQPDILKTLYIMNCKGAEGMDDVLEAALEHCYGAAEKVLIEYMSQNGITDPAAHMIVLDRIRDTNPQLLLNLINKNLASDEEAEGLLEYYYSLQEGLTFSLERYDNLRDLELADYHLNGTSEKPGGAGVYNDDGELIGIKPYYVLVNSQDGFKDDGGITFGIGHNISAKEWMDESDREHQLLSGYIPEDAIITGIEVGSLPGCRLEIVSGSTMVPIEEVNRIFYEDIQEFSDDVADTLIEHGVDVTQNEFDALVIYAYNRGSLSPTVLEYLEEGNRVPEDWEDAWSGGDNRKEYCQDLFFSDTN